MSLSARVCWPLGVAETMVDILNIADSRMSDSVRSPMVSCIQYCSFSRFLLVFSVHQDDQFLVDTINNAMYSDGKTSSHPISVPVQDPAEIAEIFDAISYEKVIVARGLCGNNRTPQPRNTCDLTLIYRSISRVPLLFVCYNLY